MIHHIACVKICNFYSCILLQEIQIHFICLLRSTDVHFSFQRLNTLFQSTLYYAHNEQKTHQKCHLCLCYSEAVSAQNYGHYGLVAAGVDGAGIGGC